MSELTLEQALTKIGGLEARVRQLEPLETEVVTLRGHKERLDGDLAKARSAKNAAEEERDSLREKVPKDGSVTLSKADSERWNVVKGIVGELGGVDKLQERLSRVDTLETAEKQREREATIRAAGFNPKALNRILGNAELKVTGEGDDLKVLVTEGDTETPLEDWAEAGELTDLLNVARLEPEAKGVRALGQAGRRSTGSKLATPEEIAERMRTDPLYKS